MDGEKAKNNIIHGAIVPLIGGFSLAATNVIGKPPEVIFSYKAFEANDKIYLQYLNQHNIVVPYYQIDNKNININEITKIYENKIDFFHGILPCSGLSQAAKRKPGSRGSAPPNDWMYKSAEFILNIIKPKIYAFENAPGLYTNAGIEVRKQLENIGKQFGYAITFYKTNTLKHGIPQFRPRTFAIFYKGEYAPMLNGFNRIPLHIIEYLKQIPKNASLQNEYVHNEWDITKFEIYKYLRKLYGENWRKVLTDYKHHLTTYDYLQRVKLLDDFQEYQKTLPDASEIVTKNISHIKKNSAEGRGARINYRVLEVDKDYTYAVIGEMMGKQVHPIEDRLLNIREHLWLMGMPFDYEIDNSRDYVKLSQNVPVATCIDIISEIIAIINNKRQLSNKFILMQDNTKEILIFKTKSLF